MSKKVPRFSLPLTRIVHENLSVVMCFAYSQGPLEKMMEEKFMGEWKYLNKVLFEISEERATRALIELALFSRIVDDADKIGTKAGNYTFGRLNKKNGEKSDLSFRDAVNKIVHASSFEWKLDGEDGPILISQGSDDEKWISAEIDIVAVSTVCGQLAS